MPEGKKPGPLAPLIRFALPLAAAVALAFVVFHQFNISESEALARNNGLATVNPRTDDDLNSYEIQEILMLQEGLSGFAQIESEALGRGDDLLATLDTLDSI